MWLADSFWSLFLGRWRGAVRIHVSHVQLLYTVINVHSNMQGVGGGGLSQTLENLEILEIFKLQRKVAGSIGSHIASSIWQPS